jgi:hypothetical protein
MILFAITKSSSYFLAAPHAWFLHRSPAPFFTATARIVKDAL